MIQIVVGVCMALFAGLVAALIWLSKSRKKTVEAQTEADILRKGQEKQREADKIMAEPVADEAAWVERTRDRLLNNDYQP